MPVPASTKNCRFTGDWAVVTKFFDDCSQGDLGKILGPMVKDGLVKELTDAVKDALFTHGASISVDFKPVSEDTMDVRDRVGYATLENGTFVDNDTFSPPSALHIQALYFTGAYAAAICNFLDKESKKNELRFYIAPDPTANLVYHFEDGSSQEIPVSNLAVRLETRSPHWVPVYLQAEQLPAWQALENGGLVAMELSSKYPGLGVKKG